ncbi:MULTISPECIES: MFS transporter [unclassified Streptomyces]|uniref:MFS transporter n=1 Tax=unclassified Streptomyces TaxID=2593676 RepID=UPI000DC4DE51|nr:MFS transporter [Streptomyces sp. PsTaAH-137]RAJ82574.1 putative MFS family arabinose efflux permease [Streptomyces sp. PsTaAH-137]
MTSLTTSPAADRRRRTGARAVPPWRVVFGAVFVMSWCGNQFSPLLLLYKHEEHYSTLLVNLLLGVYVGGLAPALLLAGALSDRYGRRPVMSVGTLTALAAGAVLALGPLGVAPLFIGRLLSGVTVGIAMAVGNSWLKELSQAPHDLAADAGAGARRASTAFTLGSGLGALVAGALAQWGPRPEVLPFVLQIAVAAPFVWLVRRIPETSPGDLGGPLRRQLRVPAAGHKRFLRVVAVAAPWLFASAALAYGYLPVLLSGSTGSWGLAYATALTGLTLGVAALIQPWAKRIDSPSSARGLVVFLFLTAAGLLVMTGAQYWQSLWLGLAAALVLGCAIGTGLVSGLLEVQRIAGPRDLAGLTGVFYTLAYAGFLTPIVLAAVTSLFGTTTLLLALVVLALLCAASVLLAYRRHLPTGERAATLGMPGQPTGAARR